MWRFVFDESRRVGQIGLLKLRIGDSSQKLRYRRTATSVAMTDFGEPLMTVVAVDDATVGEAFTAGAQAAADAKERAPGGEAFNVDGQAAGAETRDAEPPISSLARRILGYLAEVGEEVSPSAVRAAIKVGRKQISRRTFYSAINELTAAKLLYVSGSTKDRRLRAAVPFDPAVEV